MTDFREYRNIYRHTLDLLDITPSDRTAILDYCIEKYNLSREELSDNGTNAKKNMLRSRIGAIINEMHAKGVISRDKDGIYHKNTDKPIALRIELCEEELLGLFKNGDRLTRSEIKERLVNIFRTDTTATQRDDNQLFTYIGQILKHLVSENILKLENNVYYASEAKSAQIKNRQEILSLCGEFLRKIHSKGGEFFEVFFMNLLEKYLTKHGKKVIESTVTGGSADGGIDGICVTVDSLGFKETIMVQTKNRNVPTNETEVRGFYGAVCARRGTRGIFATTSEFHPVASEFLDTIDDCVGVDGKKIFSMAKETGYGILNLGKELIIDEEIFK